VMARLTRRERRFAVILAAFAVTWTAYGLIVRPIDERIATLERILPEKERELADVRAQSRQYATLRRGLSNVETRRDQEDPNFELPSFLESTIDQHKLTARLVNMQRNTLPSQPGCIQTAVEINFGGIRLAELIAFLQAVQESQAPVSFGFMHIRRTENHPGLEATVQILSASRDQNTVAANLP
jgi:type II secretory pathway component PulM